MGLKWPWCDFDKIRNPYPKLEGFMSPQYEALCEEYSQLRKNGNHSSSFRHGLYGVRVTQIATSILCPIQFDYNFLTPPPIKKEIQDEIGVTAAFEIGRTTHVRVAKETVKKKPRIAKIVEEDLKPEAVATKSRVVREVRRKVEEEEEKEEEKFEEGLVEWTPWIPKTPEQMEAERAAWRKKMEAERSRRVEKFVSALPKEERETVERVAATQMLIQESPKFEPLEIPLLQKYNGLFISGKADGILTSNGKVTEVYDVKKSNPNSVRLRLPYLIVQAKLYCWLLYRITGSTDFPYTLRIYHGTPENILYEELISKDWSGFKVAEIFQHIDSLIFQKKPVTLPRGFNREICDGCIGNTLGCTAIADRDRRWQEEAQRVVQERMLVR